MMQFKNFKITNSQDSYVKWNGKYHDKHFFVLLVLYDVLARRSNDIAS